MLYNVVLSRLTKTRSKMQKVSTRDTREMPRPGAERLHYQHQEQQQQQTSQTRSFAKQSV